MTEETYDARHVDDAVVRFWESARARAGIGRLSVLTGTSASAALAPPAWTFGTTPEEADELLALVLDGTKTATSSARRDYADDGDDLPAPGDLSIVLDGAGRPRALLRTTAVEVVPFDDVEAAHAHAEGEGDRSLAAWREVHRRSLGTATEPVGGADLVVCEHFRVLHPRPRSVPAGERVPVGVR